MIIRDYYSFFILLLFIRENTIITSLQYYSCACIDLCDEIIIIIGYSNRPSLM